MYINVHIHNLIYYKKNDEDKFFDRTITNEKNKPEVLFQDGTSI